VSEVPGFRYYTAAEALGVSTRRATIEDQGNDAAARWLLEHDPRLNGSGVADEIATALALVGLTVDEARSVFRRGRPSKALLELRERVRGRLLPIWDDDRRRDYMAEALGCDRTTLWRLMSAGD
jgi:hypothetical protein